MTITTKFDIGQTVWFMHDNKPEHNVVRTIRALLVTGTWELTVDYCVGLPDEFPESCLFPSKAALLESL